MIFGQNRNALRDMYRQAWQKAQDKLPMTALEMQIVDVLEQHPEYHQIFSASIDQDYRPEEGQVNPYMHLSLHLAVRDQVKTNRPQGITALFRKLCEQVGDQHAVEHHLSELMAEELWRSQRDGVPPDEQRYANAARGLLKSSAR